MMNTCSRWLLVTVVLLVGILTTASAGAWGMGSFANDSALDWVENFFKPDPVGGLEMAIDGVLKRKGYVDVDASSYAVAATEVLAAARGKPAADLPPDVKALLKRLPPKKVEALVPGARAALERVMKDSELRDLWAESKEFEKWKAAMEGLKGRLG